MSTGKNLGLYRLLPILTGSDHPDHLKVFADQDAAHAWFAEHDREGVAFESCDRDAQSNTEAIRARAAGIIATTDRARAALFRAATVR